MYYDTNIICMILMSMDQVNYSRIYLYIILNMTLFTFDGLNMKSS